MCKPTRSKHWLLSFTNKTSLPLALSDVVAYFQAKARSAARAVSHEANHRGAVGGGKQDGDVSHWLSIIDQLTLDM